jgi:hypothetical protein
MILNEQYKLFCKIANKTKLRIDSIDIEGQDNLPHLKYNNFCSNNIFNYISQKCIVKYLIKFNNNLNFYTTHFSTNPSIIQKLHHMCFIIILAKNIVKNNHELTVNFYDTNFKKLFPKKGIILNEENCNSGSSLIGKYNISIWRNEEYKRVLFHECLHALECDNMLLDHPEFDENISKHFCLKNHINFCETYTETWATILNLFYYGYCHNVKNIYSYYLKELNYSIRIAKSILQHYNYKIIDELFLSDTCKQLPQKTSIFNYYMCKPFFLFHINDFLKKFNLKNITLISVNDANILFKMMLTYFKNIKIKSKINKSRGNMKSLKMVFY